MFVAPDIDKIEPKCVCNLETWYIELKLLEKELNSIMNYDLFVGGNSSNMGLKFCKKNSDIYNSNM